MFEFIRDIFKALIPSSSADPNVQLAWRWAVATGMMLGFLALGAGFSWAEGLLPGLSGVATKADVLKAQDGWDNKLSTFNSRMTNVEHTMDAINLRLVKNDIQQALINSCAAQYQNNQQSLARANEELFGNSSSEGLLEQYEQLAGRAYAVPNCSTILIAPKPGATKPAQ